jgi:membrane-associated phospholipid phosphatase
MRTADRIGTPLHEPGDERLPADRRRDGERQTIAWRVAPLDATGFAGLVVAYLTASAVLVVVGLAIVEWWETSRFGHWDADVIRWFEEQRTETLTTLAGIGSGFSDTHTVVGLGILAVPIFLVVFRRWHDHVLLFGGVALESAVFISVSTLVGRDRPPVEQLDGAPTNSFPSGHIAAATILYFGFALVVFLQTRRTHLRVIAASFAFTVVGCVIVSRWYLGMHYVTDAIAGVLLGLFALWVLHWAVHRTLGGDSLPDGADLSPAQGFGVRGSG